MNSHRERQPGQLLLSSPQRHASVFISFSADDVGHAEHYRNLLLASGFFVFAFHRDLLPGEAIDETVAEEIKSCDYFLFLVSSSSADPERPWVSRELGLALATRGKENRRPVIIPMLCPSAFNERGGLAIAKFPVRDFYSGRKRTAFSISMRGHAPAINPRIDSDDQFVKSLLPQVLIVGDDIKTEEELIATGVFDLYSQIFPADEQELVANIIAWTFRRDTGQPVSLDKAYASIKTTPHQRLTGGANVYQAMTTFFVLMLYGSAIGFAYLTYRPRSRLIYGSYICIKENWRAGNWANYFVAHIKHKLDTLFPRLRGLIFEVEPIAEQRIVHALDILEASSSSSHDTAKALEVARRAKRILWYESIGGRLFWNSKCGTPLSHTYPCMDPDRPRTKWAEDEVDYWLMFLPSDKSARPAYERNARGLWETGVHESLIESLAKPMTMEYPDKAKQYFDYVCSVYRSSIARYGDVDVTLAPRFRFRQRDLVLRVAKIKHKVAI